MLFVVFLLLLNCWFFRCLVVVKVVSGDRKNFQNHHGLQPVCFHSKWWICYGCSFLFLDVDDLGLCLFQVAAVGLGDGAGCHLQEGLCYG